MSSCRSRERIWKKELGERTKEEILSQIQLKTEEQKKLEIHYKTVTEAREVLEKRMNRTGFGNCISDRTVKRIHKYFS